MKKFFIAILMLALIAATPLHAAVNENDTDESKAASGLPVPRFASLRSNDVNMRTGPGTRYPIEWVFSHQGLPVEIVAEYEIWRQVRDSEGAKGWVHKSALTGKRSGIVSGGTRDLHSDPDVTSGAVAHLEVGAVGQLVSCKKDWCKLKFNGIKGYLRKTDFWGAYPNEVFD
ncbi:MAG TPA: SH3 domain-containing protein [Alphaproteobacteria bacterium]|nr:SH3 domain-containing protein [Alphaproteobacteria bacterium]